MPDLVIPQSTFGEAICTLYDGDYHFGLGALVNSLAKGGYKGTVWAGHRGPLPPWTSKLPKLPGEGNEFMAGENIRIVFLQVITDIHLSLFKPQFIKRLMTNEAKDCTYMWFFDSDMYLRGGWGFFQHWATCGVGVVQDINYRALPPLDPLRHQWMRIAKEMGYGEPKRELHIYFNGGLTGVGREAISFLDMWASFIAKAGEMGMDLTKISSKTRDLPFHIPDQDALNVSAMFTPHALSPTGPEVMGFLPGRTHLYHNVGAKPWRGNILKRAFQGHPPGLPSKFFMTVCETPIQLYPPNVVKSMRFKMNVATFIARFYSRK